MVETGSAGNKKALFSLGFSTIGCPDYDLDRVIALARANGFAGVEIRFLHGTLDLTTVEELSPPRIADARRRFDDAGIAVVAINSSVRMNSLDPGVRGKQIESARVNAAMAAGLGAKYVRVFGGPLPPEQDREQTLDGIVKGLNEVEAVMGEAGIVSVIETHDAFCRSTAVLDLYARGLTGRIKVLWDTLHTYRNGESAEFSWASLGDRVVLVHVKDSIDPTPTSFNFPLTGEGNVPISSFLDVLKAAGYAGFVDFEWEKGWHKEIADPEIAIPHFARYMADKLQEP